MDRYKITIYKEFEGCEDITSREVAEDWAYTVTDKGDYKVEIE